MSRAPRLTLPRVWVVELADGSRRVGLLVRHAFSGPADEPFELAADDNHCLRLCNDAAAFARRLRDQQELEEQQGADLPAEQGVV